MYCSEPLKIHRCLYCVESSVSLLFLLCKRNCRDFLRNLTVNSNKNDNKIAYLQEQLTNSLPKIKSAMFFLLYL